MDPELLELLQRLTDTEQANPLSDEELSDLQSRVAAIASDIDPTSATDDDIAVLTEAAQASQLIRTEIETRTTAQQERAAAAQALLEQIAPVAAEDPDPGAGDGGDGGDTETPPAEPGGDGPVEVNPPDGTEGADGGGEAVETQPAVEGEVRQPVAASALPSITRLAARRAPAHKPVPTATSRASRPVLVASADVPGMSAGQPVDPEQWARGVVRKFEAVRKATAGPSDSELIYLGQIKVQYPDERWLDENEINNERKLDAVAGREALVASGGICAPVAVDYNVINISSAARPVRDGLAQFGASRGGLRYIRPHTLAQVTADAPASIWTAANDANPTSPTTKPHATFVCQSVQEDTVDAVTSIVQFGNFQSRFFPEQIAQYLETVDAVHSRLGEATILKQIADGSTATTSGAQIVGTTPEVLAELGRAVEAYRYRHRMDPATPMRLIMPRWLLGNMRADIARQAPGLGTTDEQWAVAESTVLGFFAALGVNVSFAMDSPTSANPNQGFGVQGAGQLLPWPSKAIVWLFHEGAWTFLDGGELNLGMVRDSTLNATNNFQMFSETFEKAIFRGHESLQITIDTCPSGQRASLADTSSLCVSGS